MLDIYEMVVATFSVNNKANGVRFFEDIFLLANVSLKILFGMFSLTLSNADIDFLDQKLRWRSYINQKTLLIIRHVKLIQKKEFAALALDPEYDTFVVYVTSFSSTPFNIHPFHRP